MFQQSRGYTIQILPVYVHTVSHKVEEQEISTIAYILLGNPKDELEDFEESGI